MADVVEIMLALRQVRQFISGANRASGAIEGIGRSTEKAGKKAGMGWKGIAKFAGGAAALYGAQRYIRGAVTATEDLAKGGLALQRTTGMDIETSSKWAAVLKVRGVQANMFQRGLVKLSKEMEKTRAGTKKHNSALEQLGITNKDVAIRTGDTESVIFKVSDALSKMRNPAKRAALAQTLFARQAIQLAPLLFKGSDALREQLGLAEKYGATLGGKTPKQIKELIAHEREMKLATLGLKVSLGTALMPAILSVSEVVISLTRVLQPFLRNATLMKVTIIALTVAFVLWKIAMIAATIANLALNATLLITVGIVLLAIIVLAALAIGFYLLYKKVGWFRAAVQATWGWIKKNWPLLLAILLGPFAIAALLIVRNFDKIKAAASGVAHAFVVAFGTVKEAVRGAINFLVRAWNSLQFRVPGFKKGPIHFGGFKLGVPKLAELALGGRVIGAGAALVGERGPEVVALPQGASVVPLPAGAGLGGAGGFGEANITTRVFLDSREIAQAVGRYTADRMARR